MEVEEEGEKPWQEHFEAKNEKNSWWTCKECGGKFNGRARARAHLKEECESERKRKVAIAFPPKGDVKKTSPAKPPEPPACGLCYENGEGKKPGNFGAGWEKKHKRGDDGARHDCPFYTDYRAIVDNVNEFLCNVCHQHFENKKKGVVYQHVFAKKHLGSKAGKKELEHVPFKYTEKFSPPSPANGVPANLDQVGEIRKAARRAAFATTLQLILGNIEKDNEGKFLEPTQSQVELLEKFDQKDEPGAASKLSLSSWLEMLVDVDKFNPEKDEWPRALFWNFGVDKPKREDLQRRAKAVAQDMINQKQYRIVMLDGHGRFVFALLIALVIEFRKQKKFNWRKRLDDYNLCLFDMNQYVHDWHELFIPGEHFRYAFPGPDSDEDRKIFENSIIYFNFCGISKKLLGTELKTDSASLWHWMSRTLSKFKNTGSVYLSFNVGNNSTHDWFQQSEKPLGWELIGTEAKNVTQANAKHALLKRLLQQPFAKGLKLSNKDVQGKIVSYRGSYPFVTVRLAPCI